jgi:hypothetical protein
MFSNRKVNTSPDACCDEEFPSPKEIGQLAIEQLTID